ADDCAEPHADEDREQVADDDPHHARHDVRADATVEPGVVEDGEQLAQRREVVRGAAGRGHPPDREQQGWQQDGGEDAATHPGDRHTGTSLRTDACQARTRRSSTRNPTLTMTPRTPVTSNTAPP